MALDSSFDTRRSSSSRSGIVLAQQNGLVLEVRPIDHAARGQWMIFRQRDQDALTPEGANVIVGQRHPPVTISISTVPFRSAVARRARDRSTVASSIRGNRFLYSVSVVRRLPAEMDVQKPIERRPASPRPFDFAVATSTSTCSRISLAILRTLRPAGVGFTLRLSARIR